MTDRVEVSCEQDAGVTPHRQIVRLDSARHDRLALMFDAHATRQQARREGATPVDWVFTRADATELAVELGLSPDASLEDCTLDDLPISVRDDVEHSSLRAVRDVEVLRFPVESNTGTSPIRVL